MELETGNFAPDFSIETDNMGTFSLSDQREKQNVVLYFYPKDDTPGCTVEANDFTKLNDEFEALDTLILGISKDPIKNHEKFRTKHCLTFPLGADENGSVCEAYGSWVEKSMYGKKYMGIQRDTFLIDKEGKITNIWRKVKVAGHAEAVLEATKELA